MQVDMQEGEGTGKIKDAEIGEAVG